DGPARAGKELERVPAQPAFDIRAEYAHWLIGIVQPRPGCARGLVRDHDLVEGLIALPQRLPIGPFIRTGMADYEIGCEHAPRRETLLALLIRCGMDSAAAIHYAPNCRPNPCLGDERLRCLCTHVPHRRNDFAASTETLFGRQRVLIRNHLGRSARPAEEIVERTRIKALEPIGCLALERTQRLDLFLDGSANVLSVAAARGRLDAGHGQNGKRQRDHAEDCRASSLLPAQGMTNP